MPNTRWAVGLAGLLGCGLAPSAVGASSVAARPGSPYIIDRWDTGDGLPSDSVTCIIQTHDGYLWFGTPNGLVRFDGIRFDTFDEFNTPGLHSSRIVALFEDRARNLWVGTETAGVVQVKDGQVTSVGIGQGASDQHLAATCQDAAGAVWLYTADGQLWYDLNERVTPFVFDRGASSACRALIAESSGTVWVGSENRLAAVRPVAVPGQLEPQVEQEVPVRRLEFLLASRAGGYWRLADGRVQKVARGRVERDLGPPPYPLGALRVSAACEDQEGNLILGTQGSIGSGVFWYGADGKARSISTDQGISQTFILSLCMDGEGSLWVGTDGGGLNRIKRPVFEVFEGTRGYAPGLQTVQSVCEDPQGGLWIGSNGGGAAHWQSGALRTFGPSQGLRNSLVSSVFVDRGGIVWAGNRRGGLFQLQGDLFEPVMGPEPVRHEVMALTQDRQGRLWVGTQGGLARWDGRDWKLYTTRDGLSADEVRALAEDAEGGLWIGTAGGGLDLLRGDQFKVFRKEDGPPSDDISALYLDAAGVLWVGTRGSGLGRFADHRWTRYTTKDGLASNSIGYLIEDPRGYLWIGSNAGLMRVLKRELNEFAAGTLQVVACRAYGKAEGLPTRECTSGSQPGACRARSGTLWFPTTKGLVSVDPAKLNPNTNQPPVVIEMALIDGQPQWTNTLRLSPPQQVVLPPGKERLEIRYASLNLLAPDQGRFKYWLEKYERTWTEAGASRVASYTRLPPGNYRFHVQACNEDGVWNQVGSVLAVTVQTPLWRTWWFLSAAVAGCVGLVVSIVHYLSTQRLQRQLEAARHAQALERERSRIAQDIHDQVGASLTQVALLSDMLEGDKEDPNEVETHARQIAQTARETTRVLDEIVWAVNPSNDTLDSLMTYTCKYAQEYLSVAGLRCRLDIPAQLPAVVLPPDVRHNVFLGVKEAITNVVRHAAASEVWVKLRLAPGAFVLEVQDNGRGPRELDEKAAQARNGVRGMRKRMESIGGGFTLRPAEAGGTLVQLTVPVQGQW